MKPARSIVLPIVLLVVAAVAVATAVLFAVTFSGPPPFARPIPLVEIARVLRDGSVPPELRSRIVAGPEGQERIEGEPNALTDQRIARALGVPAEQVEGRYARGHGPVDDELIDGFAVRWSAPGGPRYARSAAEPLITSWHRVTIASMLALLVGLGAAGWVVARRISHPIRNLAKIARETRLGTRAPIPQEGPREVRELAAALDAMQNRILEQAEGRTTMLAAIAHDMGTPITRLAFWVEQLPEAARNRASADIDEIRAMLASVLRFARDERADARDRIELGSLIESLVDDMKAAGTPVDAEPGPRLVLRGDSQSLRRLFANLIENAVRYGKTADIAWHAEPGWAEVTIADKGPGFPANADALFTPFVRGESSRNRATGGTGLGLSIVRSIAEAHGGAVTLETRDGHGLVRVRLPAEG